MEKEKPSVDQVIRNAINENLEIAKNPNVPMQTRKVAEQKARSYVIALSYKALYGE